MYKDGIHVLARAVIIDQDNILLCQTLDLPVSFYFLPGGGHVEHEESASSVGSSNGAVVSLSPFPSPASSNAACEFPALRFPDNFILKPMAYLMELLSHYYNIESGSLYTTSVSHIEMCYSTSSIRNRRILVTSLDDVLLSVQPTFLRN